MNAPLLQVAGLSVGYGGRPVIENLGLEVQGQDRVALIGPNGCGKSTLLRAIVAEVVESRGIIRFGDHDISQWTTDRVIRHGVGYLRQTRNAFPGLTVGENLELASWGHGENLDVVRRAFPILEERRLVRAGLLSGGERQTLAVAMVLVRRTSLLLLDEPVAGLSFKNASRLMESISSLQRELGFAMVIVEHRLKLVQPHVNRVAIMSRGRIKEDTSDTGVLADPERLRSHYLL